MNIIKFKDTVATNIGDSVIQNWYNKNVRGRYAYGIHCRYIIPLESISGKKYVCFEQDIDTMFRYFSRQYTYYELIETEEGSGIYKYNAIQDPKQEVKDQAVEYYPKPETVTAESDQYIKVPTIKFLDMEENDWMKDDDFLNWNDTDECNDVVKFRLFNTYIPDNDITIDELKNFRTWVAESLYNFGFKYYVLTPDDEIDPVCEENLYIENALNDWHYEEATDLTSEEMYETPELPEVPADANWDDPKYIKVRSMSVFHLKEDDYYVLDYYVNGMENHTTETLRNSGNRIVDMSTININSCGCNTGSSNLSSLYNTSLSVCDALAIYRKNMKAAMVEILTNLDMWDDMPLTFIEEFNNYLKGIIKANFDLTSEESDFIFGCDCLKSNNAQRYDQHMIETLIENIEFIIANGSSDGHKNSIYNALEVWATNLYENMQWN